MPGAKLCFCTSAVGIAAASALPAAENVNPATPNAGPAALVMRFFFEACFIRGMVASSDIARRISLHSTLRSQSEARKIHGHTKAYWPSFK
jgi:hypothetical protein